LSGPETLVAPAVATYSAIIISEVLVKVKVEAELGRKGSMK
jgi:hypothetical protein